MTVVLNFLNTYDVLVKEIIQFVWIIEAIYPTYPQVTFNIKSSNSEVVATHELRLIPGHKKMLDLGIHLLGFHSCQTRKLYLASIICGGGLL